MFSDVIRIFIRCCLFQASPSFVSLPCAIHLTMDSLLSGASKGASGIQSERTPSRHRYHSLSLALYDWLTEIIQLGFPPVWTKEPCIRCCPSASFGCCLLPWQWMKTHYWTVCPVELCHLSVSQNQSCETMAQSVSTSVDSHQPIAKQSVTACGLQKWFVTLFPGDNAYLFQEEGVSNYSTMLLREDLNLLVVGARESIYALDLSDISKKLSSVRALYITTQDSLLLLNYGSQRLASFMFLF